ncbi:hypothetical protein SPB21_12505 [Leptothoe sp. ISB3NOV94-8A]
MIMHSVQTLYRLIQGLNRGRQTGLVGLLILLISLRYSWYHLPAENLEMLHINSWPEGQLVSAGVLLAVGLGFGLMPWHGPPPLRWILWSSLGLTLLFPYSLMTWCPQQAFLALSYWHQLEQVNIQVETSFADVHNHWKQFISLAQFQPLPTLATFNMPDSRFFQLSQWDHVLLDGLGYGNGFFAFIGKGWSLTIVGLTILLLAVYLKPLSRKLEVKNKDKDKRLLSKVVGIIAPEVPGDVSCEKWLSEVDANGIHGTVKDEKGRLGILYQDLRTGLPIVALILCLLLSHMIGANLWDRSLEVAYARGNYATVIQQSPWLMRVYPPVQGDPHAWMRYGKAQHYGGQGDAGLTAFYQGMAYYQGHDFAQAIPYLRQALHLHPHLWVIREHLAAALINQAIVYFNAPTLPFSPHGNNYPNFSNSPLNPIAPNSQRQLNNRKSGGTSEFLEQALIIFPGHIQALYDLMIVKAIDQQFEASAAIATTILNEQTYFQSPNIGLMGQAHVHKTWAAYHRGDLDAAWESYRRSVDSDAWGEETKTHE